MITPFLEAVLVVLPRLVNRTKIGMDMRLWFGYNCNAPEKPLQGGNNNACS